MHYSGYLQILLFQTEKLILKWVKVHYFSMCENWWVLEITKVEEEADIQIFGFKTHFEEKWQLDAMTPHKKDGE